ncbi:hypothetical protein JMJ56_32040 [Belnapia sp. T18]|uniref:Lipoprotein n=1 Tax=Belnapia arida TaxID=2804533 RepID=A0ABS1UD57_9PROT|nr:hypothetical protein [Belnapia arida]MBL6082598.1 hypothetical protein [Belnapia arida]
MRLSLLGCVLLAGCVGSEVFVLRNPATGEIKECRAEGARNSFFPIAQAMIDNSTAASCARGYQAAGWQKMN